MPRRPRSVPISIAALAFALAGCAAVEAPVEGFPPAQTIINVQNRGWEPVTVSVVRGGVPIRIGIVEGLTTREFVLPPAVMGSGLGFQLRSTRRLSGEVHDSQKLDLIPGDRAQWVIEQTMSLSHLVIR